MERYIASSIHRFENQFFTSINVLLSKKTNNLLDNLLIGIEIEPEESGNRKDRKAESKHKKTESQDKKNIYLWQLKKDIGGAKLKLVQDELDKLKAKLSQPTKRGFTWEDSFTGEGAFVLSVNSEVCEINGIDPQDVNKCVFSNIDYANSALAYAQLTHIVAKYNEGKERDIDGWVHCIEKCEDKLLVETFGNVQPLLTFHTLECAEISLEVNRELWEQFWMLK
jgi:hypothetical protein